jgi:hypothetical protein
MTVRNALRVIRVSAMYDFVVTVGFAFAVTAVPLLDGLGALHNRLGLTGTVPDASDPFTVMFANLMGSVVTVWALFRILRPTLAAGAADVVARMMFSVGMLNALLDGASPLVLAMLLLEVVWALAQGGALVAVRRAVTATQTRRPVSATF